MEVRYTWNQEQYTLAETLLGPDLFDAVRISCRLYDFRLVMEGVVVFSAVIPPV